MLVLFITAYNIGFKKAKEFTDSLYNVAIYRTIVNYQKELLDKISNQNPTNKEIKDISQFAREALSIKRVFINTLDYKTQIEDEFSNAHTNLSDIRAEHYQLTDKSARLTSLCGQREFPFSN